MVFFRKVLGPGVMQNGGGARVAPPNPPPGGTAAVAQQTTASQLATYAPFMRLGSVSGRTRSSQRRAPSRPKRSPRRARSNSSSRSKRSKKPARLIAGSMAAKRHMAKLRRMQKRRR